MADLLTHVLVTYVLATVLSWKLGWLTPPYATVAMAGATLPDLNRLELVVPAGTLGSVFGIPFHWGAFHTFGGSVLVVLIGTILVPDTQRGRVFGLLVLGVLSHLGLDLLLVQPTPRSYAALWPFIDYRPPTVGLYRSTDRWPAAIAVTVAGVVALITRRRNAD